MDYFKDVLDIARYAIIETINKEESLIGCFETESAAKDLYDFLIKSKAKDGYKLCIYDFDKNIDIYSYDHDTAY